jgi:hypothetical protein
MGISEAEAWRKKNPRKNRTSVPLYEMNTDVFRQRVSSKEDTTFRIFSLERC